MQNNIRVQQITHLTSKSFTMKNDNLTAVINSILAQFKNLYTPETDRPGSVSYHVYHRLENNYTHTLENKEITKMYYHFCRYEECLRYFKEKELHTGELLYQRIQQTDRNFDSRVKAGMDLLYWAMSAYRWHVRKNMNEALTELGYAIESCEQQVLLSPFIVSSIQEQWLNKLRVYFRIKDLGKALEEAISLLHFSFTGIYKAGKPHITDAFKAVPSDEQRSMIIHILNNLMFELQRPGVFDTPSQNEFLQQLFTRVYAATNSPVCNADIFQIIKLQQAYYRGDLTEFSQLLNDHFSVFKALPKRLQQLTIRHFTALLVANGIDITSYANYPDFLETTLQKQETQTVIETSSIA